MKIPGQFSTQLNTTWTLNQAPGDVNGAMVSPYFTVGASGAAHNLQISYNTVLMTPSTASNSNTAIWYVSTGAPNYGVPMAQFTGSVDHNVMVNDLTPSYSHRSTSALVEFAYNAMGTFSVAKNYVDPTGAFYCWPQLEEDPSVATNFTGNVNMLNASDPYVNQQDNYAVVPYVAGTSTNTQAENGISYNASTGLVTVRLSNNAMPAAITVGSQVILTGTSVDNGFNYLAGSHTVTSIAGNTFTFAVGTGYPGTSTGGAPNVTPYGSGTSAQGCYGHN